MSVTDQTMSDGGASAIQPARYGEVYDRGYQHYDGPRLGRRHAFGALIRYSIRRALGIKKSWTAKSCRFFSTLPWSLRGRIPLGIQAFVPGARARVLELLWIYFSNRRDFCRIHSARDALRRQAENVLSLYFSRRDHPARLSPHKLLATAILTLTISLAPCVVYWLGRQLLVGSPLTKIRHNYDDLGRILVAGTMIALLSGRWV